MSLGVHAQDEVVIHAFGPNAQETVAAIKNVILSLEAHKEPAVVPVASGELPPALDANRLRGVVASRGLVVGRAFRLRRAEIAIAEQGNGIAHERSELERARTVVRTRLQELAASAQQEARQVIEAHLEFVDDPELVAAATSFIEDGKSAALGWRRAIRNYADAFKSLGDARMAERVDDLADVEHQVIAALTGDESASQIQIPDQAIVIAADLQPSQFVALDRARLAGVCLAAGGPTSHVAILAAAAGIPLLVALGKRVQDIADGRWLVLDADQGILHLAPTADELTKNSERVAARREQMEVQRIAAQRDCYTSDAVRIEVFANLGSLDDAKMAMTQGAEGCGLLRTEFLFLDRERAPDEGEQLECYQEIANALAGRPLVIRTLDIGGDKPIPYLPLPAEANPALGLRGVRTSLWRPDLLRTQLRAILRVKPQGQSRILLPMITDIEELRTIRRLIEEVRAEMEVAQPSIGVMIETPASAVLADQLAREVDFLSIGTNDLTQYTLAMDRGHADLATRLDGLHPGVLRLIAMACDAASKHQRLVAVCGGLASDPIAAPVLVGLGVGELSVVPAMIPQIKQLIASITLSECRALAQTVLQLESAEQVRSALRATHRQSEGVPAATAKWG
jgi:phosphocarrier protein FPr/phosphocarrier protein